MNEQENKCLDKTTELWNELMELDFAKEQGGSPHDALELQFHIHAIQNYIFARSSIKKYRANLNELQQA